jgi:hypothetical protein
MHCGEISMSASSEGRAWAKPCANSGGKEKVEPFGLYSLENNLMVNKILEAAKQSAATGKTVLMH